MAGFEPIPGPQTLFLSSTADELFYGGLPYGGKSKGGIIDALGLNHTPKPRCYHPMYHAVIFRREERQLSQLIRYAKEFYPGQGGRATENGRLWTWPEGGTITLSHMHGTEDYLQWQGHNMSYVLFDELPQFTLEQYGGIFPWVRSTAPDLPAYLRTTGNPIGPGVRWVRDRFIMRCRPNVLHIYEYEFEGKKYQRSRQFIPSSFRDNPYASDSFVAGLLDIPNPNIRTALLNPDPIAAWSVVMGSFFSQFSNVTHVVKRSDEAATLERLKAMPTTRVEGLDYGYRAPFGTLWMWQDPEGDVYITNEHYAAEKRIDYHAAAIHRTREKLGWEQGGKQVVSFRTMADPSIWFSGNRSVLETDKTIGQELASRGIVTLNANNNIIQGLSALHDLLYTDGIVPARLHIFESCHHLISELTEAVTAEDNPERIKEGCADHLLDCARYAGMYLTKSYNPKETQKTTELTWNDWFEFKGQTSEERTYARGNAA